MFAVLLLGDRAAARAADFGTLKGHGGPVMDIAVDPETDMVATASFDNSVGLWSDGTPTWFDGHDAAVKVVRFVDQDRMVSAGDDNALYVWSVSNNLGRKLTGHTAKIMGLAVSPDKSLIASASWDTKIGLWPLDGGEPVFLSGHSAGVNKVQFSADGRWLYSVSVDGSAILWDVEARSERKVIDRNGFGINVLALGGNVGDRESWIAYGSLDGVTRIVDIETGDRLHDFSLERRPILSMSLSPDGTRLATGDGHGYISIINTQTWQIEKDFRAALKGPIWALAFSADGTVLHAGGIESIVYSWPVEELDQYDPMAETTPEFLRKPEDMGNGERQFARKCSICHALTSDGGRKAGPTLHNIFGRRAGTLEGYKYSDTLVNSDIVWSDETIDQLFLDGPDHYIPGSKMPMQRIVLPKDRSDLIDYLKQSTQPGQAQGEEQ